MTYISPEILGLTAGFLAVAQAVPYIWSILKGRTRPSRTSYAIWSVIQTIGFTSYIVAGSSTTHWVLLATTISAVIIFGLSLKYGVGGRSRLDFLCLLAAGIAILLWVITRNPAMAVYATALAGFIGYLPTIKKAYTWPESESLLAWAMCTAAALLNVFALTTSKPEIMLPPLLGLALASVVTGLLVSPHARLMQRTRKI